MRLATELARPRRNVLTVTSAPELQKSLKKIGKKTVMIEVVKAWLPQ